MKKLLMAAALLAALLLAAGTLAPAETTEAPEPVETEEALAPAETEDAPAEDTEDEADYAVAFDGGGYAGFWVRIDALEAEFFLPEDWTGEASDEEYRAESPNGGVRLVVSVFGELEAGEDAGDPCEQLIAQIDGDAYATEANGQGVVAWDEPGEGRFTVIVPDQGTRAVAFQFERDNPEAMPDAFALEIAGTLTNVPAWY